MSDTVTLSVDAVLTDFADLLVLKSPAGQKAIKSTIREMSTWLSRQVKRAVSKSIDVRQKDLNDVLEARVKTKVVAKEFYAEVWIGLDPFPLHMMGAEQAGNGVVWADRHLRLGAFIANIYDKKTPRVWRRKFTGPGSSKRGRKDGKFPVILQGVDVYEVAGSALKRVEKQASEEFAKRFVRRLDFYLNPPKRKPRRSK